MKRRRTKKRIEVSRILREWGDVVSCMNQHELEMLNACLWLELTIFFKKHKSTP